MKQILICLFIFFLALNVMAQNTLTGARNYFRSGDKLTKQQVEFKDPGPSGKNITWDFSMLNSINEKYKLVYFSKTKGDTINIVGHEHETSYRYSLRKDTLWLTDYENRTTRMIFDKPEAQLRYPFRYGDSLRTEFSGKGLYCLKEKFIAIGLTTVTVDASGVLITPTRDTLKNIIRIKRLRDYTQIGMDSARLQLETYSWYAKGYRYPVFETYKSIVLRGDSSADSFKTSFYYPVDDLKNLAEDPLNQYPQADEVVGINAVFTEGRYLPNPVTHNLYIDYKLTRPAKVWFTVHNNIGVQQCQTAPQNMSEGANSTTINMNHLITGTYALYVHVDDMVMRQLVVKK